MEKLDFPVIKGSLPHPKWLSMDDYVKFVNLLLEYKIVDIKFIRKQKRLSAVNVPFSLKG
jgi:hypothetical protein